MSKRPRSPSGEEPGSCHSGSPAAKVAAAGAGSAGAAEAPAWPRLPKSSWAARTNNPIRALVDSIKLPARSDMIALSLGDPTVFGNMRSTDVMYDALVQAIRDEKANGYGPSSGLPAARKAIAARESTPTSPLTDADVIVASGCSGALEIAIKGLLSEGDNLLVPCPGFALYQTIAEGIGASVQHYRLLPERDWEADIEHLDSLVNSRTRAILVNNPSNPCGCVYSRAHLLAILAVAERRRIPIIADEIYGNLCFTGETFFPIASLTTTVPVLAVGGIAKEFLVPGWRVGWLLIHDRNDVLATVREGLMVLTQVIIGANTLIQSILPAILTPAAGSHPARELEQWRAATIAQLESNANLTVERIRAIPFLRPVRPAGTLYVMVEMLPELFRGTGIQDDMDFVQKLLSEEAVFVLPGKCFGIPNFFRIVFSAPRAKLEAAYDRMAAFCARYAAVAAAGAAAAPAAK
jgi:tyrosine aminotransferase